MKKAKTELEKHAEEVIKYREVIEKQGYKTFDDFVPYCFAQAKQIETLEEKIRELNEYIDELTDKYRKRFDRHQVEKRQLRKSKNGTA